LKFDVAYARWGAGYSDTLVILASSDCGETYQSLYLKGGSDLATSPDFQEYFTPSSAQWRTDSIDLSAFSNETNLQIAFRNIGRYGNVLYLDNINLGNITSLNEQIIHSPIVFPNPIRPGENLAVELAGEYTLLIIDQKGSVIQREYTSNNSLHKISSNISQGVYSIQIQTATKIWNIPLMVIK
jgi:hypothetical protein